MSSYRSRRAVAAIAAGVAALAGGSAVAVAAAASDTAITISARTFVSAPADSPIDFPGVETAREGRPLPTGYVAIARDVRIKRGGDAAYAALRMTCPRGKTWRSVASIGDVAPSVLDRKVAGKRTVLVMATPIGEHALGETAAGTIHALCR